MVQQEKDVREPLCFFLTQPLLNPNTYKSTKCVRSPLVNRQRIPITGEIFQAKAPTQGVMQDKKPRRRLTTGLGEAVTAIFERETASSQFRTRQDGTGRPADVAVN